MPSIESPDIADLKSKLPLILIIGPTAVGKTEMALQLASQFRSEIILVSV